MSSIDRSTSVVLALTQSDPSIIVTSFNGATTSPRFAHVPVWMCAGCGTLLTSPAGADPPGDAPGEAAGDCAETAPVNATVKSSANAAPSLILMSVLL